MAHTAGLIDKLRLSYPRDEWALFADVRNATGIREEVRYADAIGVRLFGAPHVHGFELKTSRSDWLRERKSPEKSGPLKLFCHKWYLCVRAPWKRVVMSTSELPAMWGLVELGTGAPNVVVEATLRPEAEPIRDTFMQSLLRSAGRAAEVEMGPPEEVSPRIARITRPSLSRDYVGLDCGHVARRPLAKMMPATALCFACPKGLPGDGEIRDRVIVDSSDEELLAHQRKVAKEVRRRGLVAHDGAEEGDEGGGEP